MTIDGHNYVATRFFLGLVLLLICSALLFLYEFEFPWSDNTDTAACNQFERILQEAAECYYFQLRGGKRLVAKIDRANKKFGESKNITCEKAYAYVKSKGVTRMFLAKVAIWMQNSGETRGIKDYWLQLEPCKESSNLNSCYCSDITERGWVKSVPG